MTDKGTISYTHTNTHADIFVQTQEDRRDLKMNKE